MGMLQGKRDGLAKPVDVALCRRVPIVYDLNRIHNDEQYQ